MTAQEAGNPKNKSADTSIGSMKNLLLLSLFLIVAFTGFLTFSLYGDLAKTWFDESIARVTSWLHGSVSAEDGVEEEVLGSVFESHLATIYHKPIRLYSEGSLVDVSLEEIGLEKDGTLAVPSSWYIGGWYVKSARAGESGNIIIDGHYDTNTGAPAAFWELQSLNVNDKVFLVNEVGKEFTYEVYEVKYVDISDPNRLEQAFSSEPKNGECDSNIIMITCGGVWVPGESTYSKRLVVKARLCDVG